MKEVSEAMKLDIPFTKEEKIKKAKEEIDLEEEIKIKENKPKVDALKGLLDNIQEEADKKIKEIKKKKEEEAEKKNKKKNHYNKLLDALDGK